MKPTEDDATTNSTTLSECTNNAAKKGYTKNFKVVAKGLTTDDENVIFQPDQISISNFHRFEGYNNPDDSSIVYLIETNDGTKGILIDAYGAYADAKISSFIKQVEDIHKKTKTT